MIYYSVQKFILHCKRKIENYLVVVINTYNLNHNEPSFFTSVMYEDYHK